MTVAEALLQGARLLEEARIHAPRLTSEVLLAHAIGCERAWLFAHSDEELSELWWIHFGRYLHERLSGKPTQYITRTQEFYGREFDVSPDVLIPRPETEHVVEQAIERARSGLIVDIGTGSGAIAVNLALETSAPVIGTDISPAALRLAARNARRLGAHAGFVACDLGSALPGACAQIIASNPPYVPERDRANLQREIREFEPEIALFGGADGFDVYRRLIPEAARLLAPGGWLILELAYHAAETVRAMLESWEEVQVIPDLAGIPRVAAARKRV